MTFRKNYISGAVQIYGAYTLFQGNEVDGTKNNGNGGNGIQEYYDVSHNNTFQSNYIHNFSSRGIWSMHRTHDDVFESNTIKNINNSMGMCIDLDGYGDIEWRQTVTGNILNHCVYAGIQLENAFASSVKNNTMTNAIGIGIAVISYQSCQVGGESNQYGSSSDCRGLSTNNVVQGNKLSAATSYGYNGIVNWYTAGLSILNNTITASDFKHSAINVCGTTSQVKGSVVSGNTTIISGTSLAPTTKLVV